MRKIPRLFSISLSLPLIAVVSVGCAVSQRLPNGGYVARPQYRVAGKIGVALDPRLDKFKQKLKYTGITMDYDVGASMKDALTASAQSVFQEAEVLTNDKTGLPTAVPEGFQGLLVFETDPAKEIKLEKAKDGPAMLNATVHATLLDKENQAVWKSDVSVNRVLDVGLKALGSQLQYEMVTSESVRAFAAGAELPLAAKNLDAGLALATSHKGKLDDVAGLYAFGSNQPLENNGVFITPSAAVVLHVLALERYGIAPEKSRLLRIGAVGHVRILYQAYGDRPDFPQDVEFTLKQGQSELKPRITNGESMALPTPRWPEAPAYSHVLIADVPSEALDLNAPATLVAVDKKTGATIGEYPLNLQAERTVAQGGK